MRRFFSRRTNRASNSPRYALEIVFADFADSVCRQNAREASLGTTGPAALPGQSWSAHVFRPTTCPALVLRYPDRMTTGGIAIKLFSLLFVFSTMSVGAPALAQAQDADAIDGYRGNDFMIFWPEIEDTPPDRTSFQ